MKRIILLLATFTFCTQLLQAQKMMIEKISLPATGEEFGIYADIGVNEWEEIFYDLQSPNPNQKVRSKLTYGEATSFISSLQNAKEIYIKWSQIAQQKGYTLFSKRIPTSFADQNIAFTQDNVWHYEKGVDICSVFLVDENGHCFFVLNSDYMTSEEAVGKSSSSSFFFNGMLGLGGSNSEYTIGRYCGGSNLTFSSIDEIDEFIKKLQSTLNWKKKNVSIGKEFK